MSFFSKHEHNAPRRRPVAGDMRDVSFKHKADAWIFRSVGKTGFLLDVLDNWLKMAKWPGAMSWHPLLKPKNNHWYNFPANVETLQPPAQADTGGANSTGSIGQQNSSPSKGSLQMDLEMQAEAVPLSERAVRRLIDEAEYIHILDECLCRHGRDCKHHRHDLGCMFLGRSGCDVTPEFSRPATKEEAYAHLHAGIEDGLMPMAGRIRVDNWAFILPDHHSLIGVCLCCDCCCFMGFYRNTPPERLDQVYHRMDGVRLEVDVSACIGCGTCAQHCYLNAISIVDGVSQTSEMCRTCGRCVNRCVQGARRLVTDDAACADKAAKALLDRADIRCAPGEEPTVAMRDTRR